MRRSLCPSVLKSSNKQNLQGSNDGNCQSSLLSKPNLSSSSSTFSTHPKTRQSDRKAGNNGDMIIQVQPAFSFLTIKSSDIHKRFVIPSGARITAESIRLRSIKTLGPRRTWTPILPGQLASLPQVGFQPPPREEEEEEDEDAEGLPTSTIGPYEPLVLWTDEEDPENKVEVVPFLACKLRPHQREGVQFLFECVMGLKGFEGNGCILADDMGE